MFYGHLYKTERPLVTFPGVSFCRAKNKFYIIHISLGIKIFQSIRKRKFPTETFDYVSI